MVSSTPSSPQDVQATVAGVGAPKKPRARRVPSRFRLDRAVGPLALCVLLWACVAAAAEVPADIKLEPTAAASTTTTSTAADVPHGRAHATNATAARTDSDKDVSILKQINKVNDDGSYTFGYEASDGSFKVETRDVAGNVKGMFGFVDEAGRLKRVSYSASNSSGFQTAAGGGAPSKRPPNVDGDGDGDGTAGSVKSAVAVKKLVSVSKRPVQATGSEETGRRRGGNDLRRQLPRNDEGDAPDVYGVHGRSSMQSGPVSPVVSALMSELDPVRSYGVASRDTISRQAQVAADEDDSDGEEPAPPSQQQYHRAVPPSRYRQTTQQLMAASYQQEPAFPVLPTVAQATYQPQQVASFPAGYGPSLTALRDELMELILSYVQARVSQLVPAAPPYGAQQQLQPLPPQPYPMPYQQPNYYVPSYYQGPRIPAAVVQRYRDGYAVQQQPSPRVTQTIRDGLIRMLLSTSPRYGAEGTTGGGERAPRLTSYRRTVDDRPSAVRNVQIIGEDIPDSRPVTTETPD